MKKKLFIKTYGCQMNVYDSSRMADLLQPLGYMPTEVPDDADMIILNTCHIREKATEKVFSDLGRLRPFKEARTAQGNHTILAVAGCVAQAEGDEILKRAPYVDMVFGPQAYHNLPEMIAKAARQTGGILDLNFQTYDKFDALPEISTSNAISAFLTIQEGCDKFCHFCCVPYTRGAEVSRDVRGIAAEAQRLLEGGAREITLLGQNVNAFHGTGPDGSPWGLGRLLIYLAETIPEIARWRYTTSHPRDVDDALIEAHHHPRVAPHLHLPVQSGSDRILRAMNRQHTADFYRAIIEKFKSARPDMMFSSDFIVGYPGETDADFAQTLRLVEDVTYGMAYSFTYSPRPGTPAAALEDQVPEEVKTERLSALQSILFAQQTHFNMLQVGRRLPVLFDRKARHMGQITGRSPFLQSVHMIAESDLIGQVCDVEIIAATQNSLTGVLVEASKTL